MRRTALAVLAFGSFGLAGCVVGDPSDASAPPDQDPIGFEARLGNPRQLAIGFNFGADGSGVDEFRYLPLYTNAAVAGGARSCHTYVQWNAASEPAGMGDAHSPAGHRAAFAYWLHHAQSDAGCTEVLVSFQDHAVDGSGQPIAGASCAGGAAPPCEPPSELEVHDQFLAFVSNDWASEAGYTGTFAFTPWNEPNNPNGAGNGLGEVIPPALAASYFLTMSSVCAAHGCEVAAGDFASNGNIDNGWPADFEHNCANDNVSRLAVSAANGKPFCRDASAQNPDNARPASYLDIYKNHIALNYRRYAGVPSRPKYFLYHGWYDMNTYIASGGHCLGYDDCVTRRLLLALGGSWNGVEVWDTEDGVSQGPPITDAAQADAAAFLVRLHTVSSRITRVYITRIHGGGGELVSGSLDANPPTATLRPAGTVLAQRATQVP